MKDYSEYIRGMLQASINMTKDVLDLLGGPVAYKSLGYQPLSPAMYSFDYDEDDFVHDHAKRKLDHLGGPVAYQLAAPVTSFCDFDEADYAHETTTDKDEEFEDYLNYLKLVSED